MVNVRLGLFSASVVSVVLGCATVVTPTESPPPLPSDTFQAMCGWPTDTPLAFAGWATMTELGLGEGTGHTGPTDSVYAFVTRDTISQWSHGGPVVGRGICWTDGEVVGMSGVADDWVLIRQR